jgi:hypothetical protein
MGPELSNVNLKRNFLTLFDSMKNETVRVDVTMGISLLNRNESQRLQDKIERSTIAGISGQVALRAEQVFDPKRS